LWIPVAVAVDNDKEDGDKDVIVGGDDERGDDELDDGGEADD
jgi:hypothetical protein